MRMKLTPADVLAIRDRHSHRGTLRRLRRLYLPRRESQDVARTPMTQPLDWTKLMPCEGCGLARECFACADGWRCKRCRPKNWSAPPSAEAWLRLHGGWRPFKR